jgi:hypothetical protein
MKDQKETTQQHSNPKNGHESIRIPIGKTEPTHDSANHKEEKWYLKVSWKNILEFVAVLIAFIVCVVYWQQLEVMNRQLIEMQGTGPQTAHLIVNAARQAKSTSDLATASAKEAEATKKTADAALAQAQATAALAKEAKRQADIATDLLHLDQRAWVGFVGSETIGGVQSPDGKTFSFENVLISVRNSGKTPAINVNAVTLQTILDWRETIGDYDSVKAELYRRRKESLAKSQEEQIRRNPEMADRIRAWNKEMEETEQKYASELFPAGQVIAPGTTLTQGTTVSASYGNEHMKLLVIYILGKITYNDVFRGTPMHTTKFCLMRMDGTQFVPCPTGNYMD